MRAIILANPPMPLQLPFKSSFQRVRRSRNFLKVLVFEYSVPKMKIPLARKMTFMKKLSIFHNFKEPSLGEFLDFQNFRRLLFIFGTLYSFASNEFGMERELPTKKSFDSSGDITNFSNSFLKFAFAVDA